MYSGDLESELVGILNDQKEVGLKMVWILNGQKVVSIGQFSVVSTIISGVLFARFCIVDHVPTIQSFLCDVINCLKQK